MPLDIKWTIEAHVPEVEALTAMLELWGERLVASVDSIKQELTRLISSQADGSAAIAEQLTKIADEIAQFDAEDITQEQLDKLETELRTAADTATQQAADIRANSDAIAGIVPDAPPA